MSIRKKILTLVLVVLLAFNMFLISASAVIEPTSLVGIDANLEIYKDGAPMPAGTPLHANDIITVRVAPTTDFFAGGCKIIVMFTTAYLQIQGANKAAFTVNTENSYYSTSCSDYTGTTTQIPVGSWPAALKPVPTGDGSFNSNTAVSWTTQSVGKYPSHMPGTWLFSFDLKVLQNITAGSGAKVWMDSRWFKSSTNTTGAASINKNLDNSKLTSVGTSAAYPFTFDFTEANISLEPSANVNITWNANGGTGGTTTSVANGAIPTPPTVTRTGYTLTGWTPAIVAATEDTTYTAQWSVNQDAIDGITISLTENTSDMTVSVQNAIEGCKYQVWSYQSISTDVFDSNSVNDRQWILSKAYDTTGQAGGTLNYTIDKFTSPDNNYTVAVRIVDENGNYLCEIRDSFTKTSVSAAVITKVFVDGMNVKLTDWGQAGVRESQGPSYDLYKEIKTGATTTIKVAGNLSGMTYTATVMETLEDIPASGTNLNEFVWDISGLEPRTYTIQLAATNGSTTSTKNIYFRLYKTSGVTFANIIGLTIGSTTNTVPQTVSINPNFSGGNFFYTIGEKIRKPIATSEQLTAPGPVSQEITKYGIYQVMGYANRADLLPNLDGNFYDDIIYKTLVVSRSTDPSSMTLEAYPSDSINKGSSVTFTASATIAGIGATPVQYSFWRIDAQGESMVKDWSSSNTLTWVPGRVGTYYIEARAKGEDAGSYEVLKSINVDVTDSTASKALGVLISINEDELANAKARTPITIKASATATNTDKLLYKFYVGDSEIGVQTIQNYSADQYCVWTPREAGTYTISVLVKSEDSFGHFDKVKTVTVTVN